MQRQRQLLGIARQVLKRFQAQSVWDPAGDNKSDRDLDNNSNSISISSDSISSALKKSPD